MIPEPVLWMLGVFSLCILMGVPIAVSLLMSALPALILEDRLTLVMIAQRTYNTLDSFVLLAVPFFLLAGNLMNATSVTDRLIKFADATVGHFRGGLAHINIFVSMLFAGVSGSSTADTAGVGSVLIPAMKKKGYSAEFAVAITAASSVMGVIIPPSIMLVVWGAITNTSVAKLFAGGMVPGLLIGMSQMLYAAYRARREGFPMEPRQSFQQWTASFRSAALGMFLPVIIVGGIMFGFATPTEASILAVMYAILLGALIYRTLNGASLWHQLGESARLVSLSLFCLGSAGLFGYLLSYYRLPVILAELASGIDSGPVLLIAVALICLVLGTFLDALVVAIIIGPLFVPAVLAAGIDTVHFGLVACIALSMGLITPPYGLCLLISSSIGGIPMHKALKETMLLFGVMCIILLAVIFIPKLTTALPKLL
ncbi:C4-dicarboxylate ABC transporter permease [Marinobacterium aestuarii]|uniref:TRAP transporter large permease protein n=1 Tax=Marinobacterium aestuarii TaxID=1821621 RepID=A0A1A9EZ40_9GAMM|nr:TRAP transporter large permease [Marinobacterium aestuarii]ANG62753.1 C4-dicarboxylate ABC transporter permease [Marinobacterium aestuarii]